MKQNPPATTAEQPIEIFLRKDEVAKRLGMKPRTVGDWARQGKLPAYRLGLYLRFKWEEVEAHLAATCRVVVAAPVQDGPIGKTFRHLTPALSPVEAERERKAKHRPTNPAL